MISKLMILRTRCLHTLKRGSLCTYLGHVGQENSPAQLGGGADDGSMTSTEERPKYSYPLPTFPLIVTL